MYTQFDNQYAANIAREVKRRLWEWLLCDGFASWDGATATIDPDVKRTLEKLENEGRLLQHRTKFLIEKIDDRRRWSVNFADRLRRHGLSVNIDGEFARVGLPRAKIEDDVAQVTRSFINRNGLNNLPLIISGA